MACSKNFPTGKPTVYIQEKLHEVELHPELGFVKKVTGEPIYGLVQATVLPPSALFLPALPVSLNSKLYYGLCQECMKQHQPKFCQHTDSQRALTDVWTTFELAYAINTCQYKLLEIYEIYAYEEARDIFKEYYSLLARLVSIA